MSRPSRPTPSSNSWNRNFIIAAGVLLLMALAVGLYTAGNSQRQIYLVTHTYNVLAKIHETDAKLRSAESEQRGFLITGSDGYEKKAEENAYQLEEVLNELDVLVADNPRQVTRAFALRDKIFERITELRNTAQITRRSNLKSVKELLGDESEVRVMNDIRVIRSAMIAEEEALLVKRREDMGLEIKIATITILSSGGFALLLGIQAFVMMRRSIVALDREAELLRQKETAESADREKSEFLANMSHEIRTPMNAVLGFSELLSGVVTSPKQRQYVEAINSSGRAMLSLINDILDLSKIEAGKVSLVFQPLSISALFVEIRQIFSAQTEARGLDLRIETSPQLPPSISFDQTRLRQILFNVVGNALKFTQEGSITVSARSELDPNDETHIKLIIEVTDTGIGIPPEFQDQVFEPFRQVESGNDRGHGGTGLGLSITKRLTELLGGEVGLESEPGTGTTFKFVFPHIAISAVQPVDASQVPEGEDFNRLRSSQILVADDVPLNLQLIAGHFDHTNHRLIFARNGVEALAQARKHHPDLILLDIRMPEMNGRAALAEIRADEALRHIPVVSVTASSMMVEEIELRQEFDGYLRKPFTRASLFSQLAQFIPLRETDAVNEDATAPSEADDEPTVAIPNEKWPELVATLRELETESWPALSRSMGSRETAAFAHHLIKLGQQAECPAAVAYGEKLAEQVEKFQIAAIESTLRNFPHLIHGLSEQLPP